MIELEKTKSGFRVFDRTKTEVSIETDDWSEVDAGYDINRPADRTVSGYVSEIRLPAALVRASALDSETNHTHGGDTEELQLSEDEYLLDISANIKTYLRFSGSARIWNCEDFDRLHISFSEETLVTLGFRSHYDEPIDTITVPPTPAGAATAVTYLSASHETSGPMRSYPSRRSHPPNVEIGDETQIPEPVRTGRYDTGIEMVVPDSFEFVYVAAPLAYYLQAELRVEDRQTPVLRAPEADVEYRFTPFPGFQHQVARVLQRVFYLDCLVRNADDYSWDLAEMSLLDEVGIDAETTYELSPAEQLATYLGAPYERIADELPEWHLAMHVEPESDNLTTLPYFLDNLSLIYVPESSDLEKEDLMNQSIDDFYRGAEPQQASQLPAEQASQLPAQQVGPQQTADQTGRAGAGAVKSVNRRDPVLHDGQVNGWLADGVPIDVFKVVPEAYENRFQYLDQDGGDIDVTVILNDEEMVDEHETVAEIYQERADDLPIDVTVHEHLSKSELADVLESPHDFVHYIGHCEEDGLRCSNGNLAVSDIEESKVQTFFLNACGSYYEGRDLVKNGSVAGAVTFTKVLNKQAAKVGVAFARLLINGFNIDLALRYARRRIMMGKDYAVVGDGTHILTQTENRLPVFLTVEEQEDGTFEMVHESQPSNINGSIYEIFYEGHDTPHLQGARVTLELDREELLSFLKRAEAPVVYDGDLYWSEELEVILGT